MSRNFGIGSRDMGMAGQFALNNAVKEGSVSFSTAATNGERWQSFTAWAKEHDVKKMENVTQELVMQYGRDLAEKVNDEKLSPATAQNYVSAVNSVMSLATKNEWKSVSPTKDCNIRKRSLVRKEAPGSLDRATFDRALHEVQEKVSTRAASIVELAREFGLRSKEASLLDSRAALAQANAHGVIRVADGTKGGRARKLEITNDRQLKVLERAVQGQGGDRSLVPANQSWKTWRNGDLRAAREILQRLTGGGLHDLRAAFACQRYHELAGNAAPCTGGEIQNKAADQAARLVVAQELGHARPEVAAAYLGGQR